MKTSIIHEKGGWQYWAAEKTEALKNAADNSNVGEKIAYENEEFIVWTLHLTKGEVLNFHKHSKRYFWTALSAGKSRSYYNDGTVTETEYEQGDTKYFEDLNEHHFFIHNLENIGETTLVFTTVEFKN